MLTSAWFSLGLFVLITVIVVLAGIKKQPGIGIILAVIILGVAIGFDRLKLSGIGFSAPNSWLATILWSLVLGILIAFVSTLIIEPAAEKKDQSTPRLEFPRENAGQLETIAPHAGCSMDPGLFSR